MNVLIFCVKKISTERKVTVKVGHVVPFAVNVMLNLSNNSKLYLRTSET